MGVVRYGVLGTVEARDRTGRPVPLTHRQQELLAAFLIRAGTPISPDHLIEQLWPDHAPTDPRAALRTHVSRLRQALGEAAADLHTGTEGYRIDVEGDVLDATRFEELLAAADHTDPARAFELVEQALALWRGPAFEGLDEQPDIQPEAVRLDELRQAARIRRAVLLLELQRPAEAVAELRGIVGDTPHHEQARAALMRALAASGRHTEALDLYRTWRDHLAEDLGLEPSPVLQAAQAEVLRHTDPSSPEPPPRLTLATLPRPVSRFVGRSDDLAAGAARQADTRLLTVVGPGGVGKTRFAVELAHRRRDRYPDGIAFCDLVAMDSDDVVDRVAATLGVQPQPRGPLLEQLVAHVDGRRLLVLLDGCEHVLDSAAALAQQLTQQTATVDVLATSRERLGADGEHLYVLPPLPSADPSDAAVRLFVDRAHALDADLAWSERDLRVVRSICARLDGLPLGIELAAARLRALNLDELATVLEDALGWLADDRRPQRHHRSLHALIDWSHDRLTPREQAVFRRLTVFPGGFTLHDVEDIIGSEDDPVGPTVVRLVDQSLVSRDPTPETSRYRLLDTLREYGRHRLAEAGETREYRDRHARSILAFVVETVAGLAGPEESHWEQAVSSRITDVRAAHRWLMRNDPPAALRLVSSLHHYALWRSQAELFRWADESTQLADPQSGEAGASVLAMAAIGASLGGDLERAQALATRGLAVAREHPPTASRRPMSALAEVALLRGDLARALDLSGRAADLADQAGDKPQVVWDRASITLAAAYGGDLAMAPQHAEATTTAATASGSPSAIAFAHYIHGEVAAPSDPDAARTHFEQAIAAAERVSARYIISLARLSLASLASRTDDLGTALRRYASVIGEWQQAESWTAQWLTLRGLVYLLADARHAPEEVAVLHAAVTAAEQGAALYGADADRLHEAAEQLRRALGPADFAAATARGRSMEPAAVLDLARSLCEARGVHGEAS